MNTKYFFPRPPEDCQIVKTFYPETINWRKGLRSEAQQAIEHIERYKEQYIRTWIAETGIPVEDCVLVLEHTVNGTRMYCERKSQ